MGLKIDHCETSKSILRKSLKTKSVIVFFLYRDYKKERTAIFYRKPKHLILLLVNRDVYTEKFLERSVRTAVKTS